MVIAMLQQMDITASAILATPGQTVTKVCALFYGIQGSATIVEESFSRADLNYVKVSRTEQGQTKFIQAVVLSMARIIRWSM